MTAGLSLPAVIDILVDAYNAGNARRFADHFTETAHHGDYWGAPGQIGRDAIYARYVEVFAAFPHNRTEIVHRLALRRFVIDHERITRGPGATPFDVMAIYTFEGELISRLDFVRD